ncbi:MAG: DUF308 domain-containing protein [Prochloraceae cyanobacterium]
MTINMKVEDKQKLSNKIKQTTGLGLLLIVLGLVALVQSLFTEVESSLLFEEMFLAGGAIRLLYALNTRHSKKFVLKLIVSLVYILTGLLVVLTQSLQNTINVVILGTAIIFSGIIETILAVQVRRFAFQWGWILLSGIIAIILGIAIVSGNNASDKIGILVGINILASGLWITLVSRATIKQLQKTA